MVDSCYSLKYNSAVGSCLRKTELNTMIKAIIFDLDDTLVVEEPAAIAAFMEVCREAERCCGAEAEKLYLTIRETARDFWRQSPARPYCVQIGLSSWEGLWAEFKGENSNLKLLRELAAYYRQKSWETSLSKCSIADTTLASELADMFRENQRKHQTLYDDAKYCLGELVKLFPLALITNGVPDLQREKIETTGIAKYFSEIVISGEVGYGKPDSRIYQIVLSRLKINPESTFSIGDSLERDIRGAKVLGIKTVWVNRHGLTRDESIVPDIEVSNLKQLICTNGKLTRQLNHLFRM